MATMKDVSLICEIPNFANAYLGKVTKFQGYGLFRFGVLSNLLAWRWKPPLWIGLRDNQLQLTNCPSYQNKEIKNALYAWSLIQWSKFSNTQCFRLSMLQTGDGDHSIYLAYNSLFIRRTLQHRGHSRKLANWTIHLTLFCLCTQICCLQSV